MQPLLSRKAPWKQVTYAKILILGVTPISQVDSEGGGELLVPWPGAMVLILLMPVEDREEGGFT